MKDEKRKNFDDQFDFEEKVWIQNTDFLNWYRHFFIIREVLNLKSKKILEVGSGNGVVKNCLKPIAPDYKVMDINRGVKPDYLSDIRNFMPGLKGGFDCVIAADILEHIPFKDLPKALENIFLYLKEGGKAIITIPHRADYFLFMFPASPPYVFRTPSIFLSPATIIRRILRGSWIDFYHHWEIGAGGIKKKNVENAMQKAGFKIEKSKTLLYVDFWVLKNK